MKEKTADEMFDELGYRIEEHNYGITGKVISYESDDLSPIDFMFDSEEIKIWNITIGMQELQAINKKCEELRMDLRREWKEIKGYEGKYIISNYGEIISLPRYKQNKSKLQYVEPKEILRYVNPKNGYVYVQLWNNANYKNIRLHKLVAQTFIPNKDNKPQINHIDGNKQNNRVDNLEWCTSSENIKHAYKIGLRGRGVVK